MASNSPPQQTPQSGTHRDDIPVEVEGFSEEERQEIVSQIDQVATSNRLGRSEAFSKIKPEKKGAVFPLVVNLLALILIAAGIYGANYYFTQRIDQLSIQSTQIETAEGKILEEVKKESEQKLKQKENEISKIREDLQQIEQERQALQENMQAEIESKQQELQEELEAALRRERQRLESEGITTEELEEQLQQFRNQQEEQYQTALQEYREETMQQIQEKEQQLEEAQATAEQILAEANREKEQILEQTQQREAELRQQFEAERERLTAETTEAQEELKQLSEIRQNEQLYRDQINGMYREIKTALEEGDRQEAQAKITDMREFLQNVAINEAPSVAKRRDIDQFVLGLMEDKSTKTGTTAPDESLLKAAQTISSLRTTVEEAQKLQQDGKLYEAKRYYNRAAEMIPSVSTAVNGLEEINRQERGERIRELLSTAQTSKEQDQLTEAQEQFTAAVTEAAPRHTAAAKSAVEGLIETLNTRLDSLKTEYEAEQAEYRASLQENESRIGELQQQVSNLENRISQLNQEKNTLQTEIEENTEKTTQLSNEVDQKENRISKLQNTVQQKEEKIETLNNQVTTLNNQISRLETERVQLTEQYREAQQEVENLDAELNDAVDQMAELVGRGESNSRLRAAVQRYEQFQQRSNALLTSPNSQDIAAAEAEFERFLSSNEISSLFPELSEVYSRLNRSE